MADERDLPHLPRPPSFSPGFAALLWGIGLGVYVWLFLWAVSVSEATSLVLGIVCGVVIFFVVRLYGNDPVRR
jgi:hypothetical protein